MIGAKLSTHEIIDRLSSFVVDEIDYGVDKLYMLSDKLFKSEINKKIFKFDNNVLLNDMLKQHIKKCSEILQKIENAITPVF